MFSKKIPLFSLVLLIVAAIDSIRNLPSSALFGSALIFFFIFAAIVFLIPTALISAELSATFPENGGIYHWVRQAFGEKWAMLAIWLQWINTMVWYPTILSFIAGTAAYMIDPTLSQNKTYLVSIIMIVFWSLTFLNLFGVRISARINGICAAIGTMFPMCLLIVLGAIWVFSGMPLQIRVAPDTLFPSLAQSSNWVSLIAIMASFLGMELAGVHITDIDNPQRNFPRAVLIAAGFILFSMLFGSLSIAFVLPEKEINLVAGVMQVFTAFFKAFGIEWCIPILTALIVVGSIGSIINWLISPAKGLLHASEFGYLPRFFTHKNRHGVASRILFAQGILVSAFCIVFVLQPSVNGFYWFLTALSTELYMLMYVLMYLSALFLRYKNSERARTFQIPGGTFGIWLVCLLGLFGCLATVTVSFIPPENVDIGTPMRYTMMIAAGNAITILPVLLLFLYKRFRSSSIVQK